MENLRLSFRRHLALCALALLLSELRLFEHLGGQFAELLGPNSASPTEIDELTPAGRPPMISSRGSCITLAAAQLSPQTGGPTRAAHQQSVSAVYKYDTRDDVNLVSKLLHQLQAHFPVIDMNFTLNPGREPFEGEELDARVAEYYAEQFAANTTFDELELMSVRAALRTAPIALHTSWGYASRELARQGSLPVRDDDLCAAQLQHLAHRLEHALELGLTQAPAIGSAELNSSSSASASPVDNFEAHRIYRTPDVELMRYLDAFGRAPSDVLRGNIKWYGSHLTCTATRLRPFAAGRTREPRQGYARQLDENNGQQAAMKFRYCLAALKSTSWRTGESPDYNFLRLGLCLPEACDSTALEWRDSARAIERLAKFSLARPYNSDHYKFADLYCLPDERSPMRSIPIAGKVLLALALLWLALVGLATVIQLNVDKFYARAVESIRCERRHKFLLLLGHPPHESSKPHDENGNEFRETDPWNVRLAWIKLNILLQDLGRRLVPGVDLVDCLSLYSNWLKYSQRVKLALVKVHAQEQAAAARRAVEERLLEEQRRALIMGTWKSSSSSRTSMIATNSASARGHSTAGASDPLADDGRPAEQMSASGAPSFGRHADSKTNGQLVSLSSDENMIERDNSNNDHQRHHNDNDDNEPHDLGCARQLLDDRRRVDTSSLNALKVIALAWIIAGHCIFYLGSTISNGAHLNLYLPTLVMFALSNGAIYITDLFFIITGCLTSYLVFKYNTTRAPHASEEAGPAGSPGACPTETNLSGAGLASAARNAGCRPSGDGGLVMELVERRVRDEPADESRPRDKVSARYSLATAEQQSTADQGSAIGDHKDQMGKSSTTPAPSDTGGPEASPINARIGDRQSRQGRAAAANYRMEARIFSPPFWLLVLANRYLRIMPTYALVYATVKWVSVRKGGAGQLWDYAVSENSMRRHCVNESWLPVLTLTSNFVDIYRHCIVGGWYLSSDMQFALMSVPLLVLLVRSQRGKCRFLATSTPTLTGTDLRKLTGAGPIANKLGGVTGGRSPPGARKAAKGNTSSDPAHQCCYIVRASKRTAAAHAFIFALACLSALLSSVYLVFRSRVDLSHIIKFSPHTMAILSQNIGVYTNPIFRFRAFALGLIAGHLVYLYEFRIINLHAFIQRHGSKLSVAIFALGFSVMFAPVLYPMGKLIISHDMMAILMILSAGGIDLALSALIFLVCIGKAPKCALFVLNSPYWSLFSSLSLSAFLIHTEIIVILTSQLDPPPSASYSLLFFVFSGTILLTYTLAFGLYLAFEMPLSRLIESLVRNSRLVRLSSGRSGEVREEGAGRR